MTRGVYPDEEQSADTAEAVRQPGELIDFPAADIPFTPPPKFEQHEGVQSQNLTLIRAVVDQVLTGGHRGIDEQVVTDLKKSMSEIGLKTPVTIRRIKRGAEPDGPFITEDILVAGHHRLAAAKQLGWKEIDASVLEGDDIDAELWEIDENLQRKELNVLEKADHYAKRMALLQKRDGQVVQVPDGRLAHGAIADAVRQMPTGGKTKGALRKEVERGLKIASIAPEVKEAAKEAGLANNQQALTEIAKQTTPAEQVRKVEEFKKAKRGTRKKAKRKKSIPTVAPIETPPFQITEEFANLRMEFADAGLEIRPDDILVAPGSKSASARPSKYAFVRISNRLTVDQRADMNNRLKALRDEFHTQLGFVELPGPLSQDSHNEVDDEQD